MADNTLTYDGIASKLSKSKLNTETKEILGLLISLIKALNKDRDHKVVELEQKIEANRIKTEQRYEHMETTFEEKLQSVRDELNTALTSKDTTILELQGKLHQANSTVTCLQEKVSMIQQAADEQDAYTRRESLVFSGDSLPLFAENENCSTIVRNLIREKLKIDVEPLISTAHRVGKPPTHRNKDRRDIIARFCQRDLKHRVHETARKAKVSGLYVNESLTKTRSSILYVLRQIKKMKNSPVRGMYTHNGRIFLFTRPAVNSPPESPSVRTEINTMQKLESFCENFIRKPLSTFLTKKNL